MMKLLLCLIALSLVFLTGCNPPVQATSPPKSTTEYSRFQLVSGTAYGLALDTKTGELCHTYNAKIDEYVPPKAMSGAITIAPGHPSLNSIPLCIDLSQHEEDTIKSEMLSNQIQENLDDANGHQK